MIRRFFILCSFLSCSYFQASDIFTAIESKNIAVVKKALRQKVDLSLRNKDGQTPLIVAVQSGSKSCMQELLKRGVDVNAVGVLGKTALDHAIESKQNYKVRYLVKYGAKVSSQENLVAVKKVLKRRARMFMGISLGLLAIPIWGLLSVALMTPAHPVCMCCLWPAIGLEASIATAGIATLIPGAYWYRQANKVQVL